MTILYLSIQKKKSIIDFYAFLKSKAAAQRIWQKRKRLSENGNESIGGSMAAKMSTSNRGKIYVIISIMSNPNYSQ